MCPIQYLGQAINIDLHRYSPDCGTVNKAL
jgi:hypothetical protein